MRRIVILGSTGSVGTQALDVVERSSGLEVVALAAGSSHRALLEQAERFGVGRIALADADAVADEAVAHGGELLLPPFDAGPVRSTTIRDPQGAVFTAHVYNPD